MNITVGKYLLTLDSVNVNVNEVYKTKIDGAGTGEFAQKSLSYHKNFESVCKALLEREMKVSNAKNLAELVKIVIGAKRSIVEAAKTISLEKTAVEQ
ncbi:hypothetical protein [Domibacillus tundrae]|uniref:hypothetical protein n=2 Tax=Domibacillus tundrae TaxID=1587527 RepID=UPI00061823F2|nr:hypothetical protein [Domibacillus tundrae]